MTNGADTYSYTEEAVSEASFNQRVADYYQEHVVTFPLGRTSRRKPRRWPLVLRFVKGAIHADIVLAVICHALFCTLMACLHIIKGVTFGLPPTIVPALSIVVGLMLVFRNQTSYQRFWDGRNNLTVIITSVRNLTRSFLSCSFTNGGPELTDIERADIERTTRILIAIPSAVTNHLRLEFGAAWAPITTKDINRRTGSITQRLNSDYATFLPQRIKKHEDQGLGFPLELSFLVESFIKRGHDRGWFHAPQASQLTVQLNTLIDAYGKMETIKVTPYPVAILIHQRQVLALFGAILPFTIVEESGWWSIPIVALIMFTLYGIEGIACQLEDPFGYDRNDIKMDAIVEDARVELGVMLSEWKACNEGEIRKQMFVDEY